MSSLRWRSSAPRRSLALVAAVCAGLCLATAGMAVGSRQPKTHTVTIEGTSFQPERLTVAAGDTVVWVNKDPFPHTATSPSGAFDSRTIAPDRSWQRKFGKKGDFRYLCTLHPTMKGLVSVD